MVFYERSKNTSKDATYGEAQAAFSLSEQDFLAHDFEANMHIILPEVISIVVLHHGSSDIQSRVEG